jgi:hypothetical protein
MPNEILLESSHLDVLYNLLMYIGMDVTSTIMQPGDWAVYRELIALDYVTVRKIDNVYIADITVNGLIAFRNHYEEPKLRDALRAHEQRLTI